MKINFNLLYLGVAFFLIYAVSAFIYAKHSMEELERQKYLDVSHDLKSKIKILIQEKQEAVLLVSLSLSANKNIKATLLSKNHKQLRLADFSRHLADNTSLENVWFQVIDAKGRSFYRSWTDKRGDSLLEARLDVVKMLKKPQIISSISTGKFDMTFKSMIPMYIAGTFVGSLETIAKFNSIAKKMKKDTYETLLLIDKSYKKQLTKAISNRFIDDYYIANLNPSAKFLNLIEKLDVEELINIDDYTIDKEHGILLTTYKQHDIYGENMGYILMSKKLSDLDMSELIETQNKIVSVLVFIFILILVLAYYLYIVNYKNYIQRQNARLEERVASKTEELNHIAHHDSLTSLPNRLLFLDRLKQTLKSAARRQQNVGVLFLDLDRFKEVNDTYGHQVGDKLLIEVTAKLKGIFREEDTIARLGGDEFTVILQNTQEVDIVKILNKVINTMKEKIDVDGIELNTTFSIGVSLFPRDGLTSDLLLRNADTAMYQAKDNGKNSYAFYNAHMTELAFKRIDLEKDIKRAIEYGEFEPYFQVKTDASNDTVVGVEALVRWNHPSKGLVPPDEFIPFAEEIGLISTIDNYMMRESMKIVLDWQKKGINPGVLSLNLTTQQLDDDNFTQEVIDLVALTGYKYEDLELEILEGQVINNPQKVIVILEEIRKLGVKIAIDDFGTGYSSLSYLQRLPIDKLKIDRSFIMDIPNNKDDMAIVKTIISLADNLNLELVAEGVETQEQVDFLLEEGCNVLQGYFYSKPISADDCENYLKAKQ